MAVKCKTQIIRCTFCHGFCTHLTKKYTGIYHEVMFYVRWNRKLSKFRFEPLRGREKCSEFCTVEQKLKQTLGIPFRIIRQKKQMLGIPFHVTKIEANFKTSIPNQSVEDKTTRNFIPWNKNRSKLIVSLRYFDCILKTNFFCVFPFHSVSSFSINSSADLGMSTVSSLFRGIFLERI